MATKKGVVSIGEWIITFILLAIPLVNIIMLFVWAFGGGVNLSKKNYAKASLIIFLFFIVLYIIIFAAIGPSFTKLLQQLGR